MTGRPLATGLCAASAACLLYAAFSHAWLVNASPTFELGIGLRDTVECVAQTCTEQSNHALVDQWREGGPEAMKLASRAFVPTGWVTFIVALLAAAGLAASAAYGLARRPPAWPIAPTTIGFLGVALGLISGCVFVATKPGPAGMVGVGLSFWLFGAGCVAGLAGAQLMAKVNRPLDEEWNPD